MTDPTISSAAGGGQHNWEEGRIIVSSGNSIADIIRLRRKRLKQNDYALREKKVVRDMIRYLFVIIDCSRWVKSKDPVLPGGSMLEVAVQILLEFVDEFYDQNPLSHLGFVILKNGEAEVLTKLSSSSKAHKLALQSLANSPSFPSGELSLQNGLETAGRSLGHQPRHGSREILVVCGALSTCDPGHILTETMPRLKAANIRVSTFALFAELHICRKLAEETGGAMGVCLDKGHMRDWLLGQCVPPPAIRRELDELGCEMVQMGFPSRIKSDVPTLVHATRDTKLLARTSYSCPRCRANIQELPADCVVCGLKLVLSPHLARSFHHLFPVAPFSELAPQAKIDQNERPLAHTVSSCTSRTATRCIILDSGLRLASSKDTSSCFACLRLIGTSAAEEEGGEELLVSS
jgi:transcription initiation factor TFIIH subunit 2